MSGIRTDLRSLALTVVAATVCAGCQAILGLDAPSLGEPPEPECAVPDDCGSGVCTGGVCAEPACDDAVQNGDETDRDCGGSCAPCGDGERCVDGGDCASGLCNGGVCAAPGCGDRIVSGGEDCDEGGVDTATCDRDCSAVVCGDALANPAAGEDCDDGAANSDNLPDACRTDCTAARCGDGVTDSGEACDDGNQVDDDGCTNRCELCAADTVCLIGAPDPSTVLDAIELTYGYPNNLVNSIFHQPTGLIITGEFSLNGHWSHRFDMGGYPDSPDNRTAEPFDRIVHIPAAATVIHTDQDQFPSDATRIFIGPIDRATGALGAFQTVIFDDGFNGRCNLLSSSASEFLCFDGVAIRHYGVTEGLPNLTPGPVIPLQGLPSTALCDMFCFGGTFAFDGAFYYFPQFGSGTNGTGYVVFDLTGAMVGTFTAAGGGNINGVYFDWSAGRYSTHDGFGTRTGGARFNPISANPSDTHSFSPVSTEHTAP